MPISMLASTSPEGGEITVMKSSHEGEPGTWGWGTDAWGWGAADSDATRDVAHDDDPTADVIQRLSAAFAPLLDADTVSDVVRQSRRDLHDSAPPASLEAIEKLARRRLYELTAAYAITASADTGPAAGSTAHLIIRSLAD